MKTAEKIKEIRPYKLPHSVVLNDVVYLVLVGRDESDYGWVSFLIGPTGELFSSSGRPVVIWGTSILEASAHMRDFLASMEALPEGIDRSPGKFSFLREVEKEFNRFGTEEQPAWDSPKETFSQREAALQAREDFLAASMPELSTGDAFRISAISRELEEVRAELERLSHLKIIINRHCPDF